MEKFVITVERSADRRSITASCEVAGDQLAEGGLTPDEAFGKLIRFLYELQPHRFPFEIVDKTGSFIEGPEVVTGV